MTEVTETAQQRVQKLVEDWDWPDPAILEDIVALGEDAIPALQEMLTPELLERSRTEGREDSIVYYSLLMLSEIRSPDALRLLIRLFAQVDDELVDVLPDVVYPFGPAANEPLLTLVADNALGWYPRALAAEVAGRLAGEDAAATQRIADLIRPMVADYVIRFEELSEEERETLSTLAGNLVDLTDAEARPMLEQALAEGKIDTDQFDQEYLEEVYRDGKERYPLPSRNLLEQYREDYANYQRSEQEMKARLSLLEPEAVPQPVVLGPKLGRNDPCWCGSGQKYKKCHLAQDEKEKVRL